MKIIFLIWINYYVFYVKYKRRHHHHKHRKLFFGKLMKNVAGSIFGNNSNPYPSFREENILNEILHQSETNSQLRQILYTLKELSDRVDELKEDLFNSFNEINSMLDRSSLNNNIPLIGGLN